MLPDSIKDYLLKTYQPDAILLHGSRLQDYHFNDSDYDLILISDCAKPVFPEIFQNYKLDLAKLLPEESQYFSGKTPIWPLEIVYDNNKGLGNKLLENNKALYQKGPASLQAQDILNRKNLFKRLHAKILNRRDVIQLRMHYAADIHERAVRYYFELSKRWTLSLPLALTVIEKEDQDFYTNLENLFGDKAIEASQNIFKKLFREDI